MSLAEFGGLLLVWLVSLTFILTLTWREFRRVRFNFNVFSRCCFADLLFRFSAHQPAGVSL